MLSEPTFPGMEMPPQTFTPSNYVRACYVGERIPSSSLVDPVSTMRLWFDVVARHPFFDPDKEHLVVFLLNTRLCTVGWNMVSIGALNETLAHPREVLRPCVAAAAYGFVLAHNHPGDCTTPSDADRRLTLRLNEAANLLQIRMVDHIIVARDTSTAPFSFKASGII